VRGLNSCHLLQFSNFLQDFLLILRQDWLFCNRVGMLLIISVLLVVVALRIEKPMDASVVS
jgi:hypothetical protein